MSLARIMSKQAENPSGLAAAEMAGDGRAQRRLLLAAGLLGAERSAGGLGMKFATTRGAIDSASVLTAIKGLTPEVASHFKGLVDWVESYEFGKQPPVREKSSAAAVSGSVRLARAALVNANRAREAPTMEEEELPDEEAINSALASIREMDSSGDR